MLRKWDSLPEYMKNESVKPYYDILAGKRFSLVLKRLADIIMALILLIILLIPMAIIAVLIKLGSAGPVFYRQERITSYGKKFRIHKFRTMVDHADQLGTAVTVDGDSRITKIGSKLRSCRLDELPQLFDVLDGNMSFVGSRPEATEYVGKYIPEYYATLLLPAGITSEASIRFKDEAEMLKDVSDPDKVYIEKILPLKMKYNLDSIRHFSLMRDVRTMIATVLAVLK